MHLEYRVHSLSSRSGIIVCFGKVTANSLVGKQNQMLPISSLLLCSYILGTKEKLRVLVPSDCQDQLLGGRIECSSCEEKAAAPLTMIRGFWALVLLGFNIYPGLLRVSLQPRYPWNLCQETQHWWGGNGRKCVKLSLVQSVCFVKIQKSILA